MFLFDTFFSLIVMAGTFSLSKYYPISRAVYVVGVCVIRSAIFRYTHFSFPPFFVHLEYAFSFGKGSYQPFHYCKYNIIKMPSGAFYIRTPNGFLNGNILNINGQRKMDHKLFVFVKSYGKSYSLPKPWNKLLCKFLDRGSFSNLNINWTIDNCIKKDNDS